jgi:long-chain acyl-CoA synthetase
VGFGLVRGLVGLDAVEIAVTGAAPIPRPVLEWFNAIGVPLSEIYGMSESSGPMTWTPEANRPGSVGREIPGCEVRIADDGEVICRGGNVFQGYYKQPDKTADALIDGWLHSGDIGVMDDDGYVHIVDRKKELIITSGGKNISPANLEAALKTIPLIGQAAAIGDNRKFVSAILVLDPEAAAVWATAHGKAGVPLGELANDPEVVAEVQAGVDEVNTQFAQVEQIKKFTLVGEEWLPDSDMLTPTSKLKRRGVNARYGAEIEAMYAGLD